MKLKTVNGELLIELKVQFRVNKTVIELKVDFVLAERIGKAKRGA